VKGTGRVSSAKFLAGYSDPSEGIAGKIVSPLWVDPSRSPLAENGQERSVEARSKIADDH